MKPAAVFTLGLATGLGLFAAFNFWRTPDTTSSSPSPATFESAYHEIREAGEIATSLDFMLSHIPSLLSPDPSPAIRELLQLDEREVSALTNTRTHFGETLQQAANAHLRAIQAKDGVIIATLPAFSWERQQLFNAWRTEVLSVLDARSAALFAYIDLKPTMQAAYFQGTMDYSVTFTPLKNSPNFSIVYKSTTAGGNSQSAEMTIPRTMLLAAYPRLAAHLPALPTR